VLNLFATGFLELREILCFIHSRYIHTLPNKSNSRSTCGRITRARKCRASFASKFRLFVGRLVGDLFIAGTAKSIKYCATCICVEVDKTEAVGFLFFPFKSISVKVTARYIIRLPQGCLVRRVTKKKPNRSTNESSQNLRRTVSPELQEPSKHQQTNFT